MEDAGQKLRGKIEEFASRCEEIKGLLKHWHKERLSLDELCLEGLDTVRKKVSTFSKEWGLTSDAIISGVGIQEEIDKGIEKCNKGRKMATEMIKQAMVYRDIACGLKESLKKQI